MSITRPDRSTPPRSDLNGYDGHVSTARLISLDAFRGATIAAMILVNNPGSWDHVYAPLQHAPWIGCTPTDLIFPFFLFIVGVSMAFSSRSAWGSVVKRAAVLIALGLLLNWFGKWDLAIVRWPGVLQRIGLCYLLAWMLSYARLTVQITASAIVLISYWALLQFAPMTSGPPSMVPNMNWARTIDHSLIPLSHLYKSGDGTDPEGLLSTLPATVTVMLGLWTGQILARSSARFQKATGIKGAVTFDAVRALLIVGFSLTLAGWLWAGLPSGIWLSDGSTLGGIACPVSKPLWTSSYVLLTGGLAILSLASCVLGWEIYAGRSRVIAQPLAMLGRNAILVFVGSGLLARVFSLVRIPVASGSASQPQTAPLSRWLYEHALFQVASPINASLLYALATVTLWWLIAWFCAWRRWYLKV